MGGGGKFPKFLNFLTVSLKACFWFLGLGRLGEWSPTFSLKNFCFSASPNRKTGCDINFQVPVRLHEKILELQDPVVGLAYIEELIPENDPEVHISDYCSHIRGPHILLSFIHSLHQSSAFFTVVFL